MQLGYFFVPMHPPGSLAADWIDADLEQVVELDRLGFDEAWFGEHFTSEWEPLAAPELMIARALGITQSIRLGTGVNSLGYHHPIELAARIALLDHMARGRFMWGIGAGVLPTDGALFDVDFVKKQQRTRLRATLSAVLDLWDDPQPGVYESAGFHYVIPQPDVLTGLGWNHKPYTLPHPLIAAAGTGPNSDMLTLAGEHRWAPLSIPYCVRDTLLRHWETYETAAQASPGGVVPDRATWRVNREIIVAATTEEALDIARTGSLWRDWSQYLIPRFRMIGETRALKVDPSLPDEALDFDYCVKNLWIVGDVETVIREIQDLHDYTGGFGVLHTSAHEWDAEGRMRESVRLLAEEVRPRLP